MSDDHNDDESEHETEVTLEGARSFFRSMSFEEHSEWFKRISGGSLSPEQVTAVVARRRQAQS